MFNRKCLFLAAIAAAVSAPVTLVHADPTTDARKAIQAQYDRAHAALAKKDLNGAFAICTADHTEIDTKGAKHTIAEVKQQASTVLAAATSINISTVIQSISVSGAAASVTVKYHAKIVMQNPQTKKPSVLIGDSVSQDIWSKIGGAWLQKTTTEKSNKMTVDGKELPQ